MHRCQLANLRHGRAPLFTLRPRVPLFLPGEVLEPVVSVRRTRWLRAHGRSAEDSCDAENGGQPVELTVAADASEPVSFQPTLQPGMASTRLASYCGMGSHCGSTAALLMGLKYLLSGPKSRLAATTSVDGNLCSVGTTYVKRRSAALPDASECLRLNQDMAHSRDGLNMIRSGLQRLDPEIAPNGEVSEDALRTIEGF